MKDEVQVGLSSALPIASIESEDKLQVADVVERIAASHVKYTKRTLEFELEMTADEVLERSPERIRCHRLISTMPAPALGEVEEELRETYKHYLTLAQVAAERPLLPPPREVTASVIQERRS